VIDGYAPARGPVKRGLPAVVVLGAVFVGVACGAAWDWRTPGPSQTAPSSAIEWNAVQAVPTRAPDAEDVAWEKRAEEANSPVIASPAEERGDAIQPGLPRTYSARNDKPYVIDGDTFGVGSEHIRIAGMDAPETHPPRCMQEAQLGLAATAKLKELLSSGTVTMSGSGRDQYGRELRQVSVNGVDVAQTMIGAGLARSYGGGKKQGWC
jgi:hypothetical protein